MELLDAARHAAARSVNALMTATYWEIGRRIVEAEQQGKRRAGYGEQLIARLSADLTARFWRGFGVNNLENMRRFFLAYPRSMISQTLPGKLRNEVVPGKSQTMSRNFDLSELAQVFTLPRSAYVQLLSVKDDHARRFYETEARRGGWSVRQFVAANYRMVLPDTELLQKELEDTRRLLESRGTILPKTRKR